MGAGNRTTNELFIGPELMNTEGPSIKHPAFINYYANINVNKTSEDPIKLAGIDIETDSETGEMYLLGIYYNKKMTDDYTGTYYPYYEDIFENFVSWVKRACDRNFHFAHWNRLDPFQMLKLFMIETEDEDQMNKAMQKFGKESGEFNKELGEWEIEPVVKLSNGIIEFGIKNVIRSSIQFFYRYEGDEKVKTCWAYDIASFYNNGLEKEADANSSDIGRFNWYSKLGEEFHIVDWSRFFDRKDNEYTKNVLYSNQMDARGAMALGYETQKDFFNAFQTYPRSLVSTGSLARSAIIAVNSTRLENEGYSEELLSSQLYEDISSIGLKRFLDEWTNKYGQETVKNMYSLFTEAYAGGKIDAIAYGYAKEGYYADLASAYPGIIQDLYDLRGATIETGKGEPPTPEKGYIFIRGLVNMPEDVDFHSITVRHPVYNTANVSPVGEFYASYTWDEREFAKEQGATFEDEEWFYIKTQGKRSVLGRTTVDLVQMRKELKAKGSTSEYMAKLVVNSMYGIQFEAVDTYTEEIVKKIVDGQEVESLNVRKDGYRAGEFWNPLYASIITSRVRIQLAKASQKIKENGGQPIVLMTDSITWKGPKDALPERIELPWGDFTGIKEEKTLGWFEPPEKVKDIVCLGSGRYGFYQWNKKKEKWEIQSKRRGLNIAKINKEVDGIIVDIEFNWHEVLAEMRKHRSTEIDVKVRTLISPVMAYTRKEYTYKDIGRLIDDKRNINAIVGKTKRLFVDEMEDPEILSKELVITNPVVLKPGMFGKFERIDTTLSRIRELMMEKNYKTRHQKEKKNKRKRWKKYHKKNKDVLNLEAMNKYDHAKEMGFEVGWRNKISRWSWDRIKRFEKITSNGFSINKAEKLSRRSDERTDKYLALINSGFTEEQADELSKKQWEKVEEEIQVNEDIVS